MSFDNHDFRHCMGHFATGVAVVTMSKGDEKHGITVNSFSSLSLTPPLVMFAIDKSANSYEYFVSAENFVINILSENQIDISQNFAKPSFVDWSCVENSISKMSKTPVIRNCNAHIECASHIVHDGGDHSIIVGKVVDLQIKENSDNPLIYYKGKYDNLKR